MASVHPARVVVLADLAEAPGRYVLYWMQVAQRARANHALEHAVARADALGLPVVVGFGLTDRYPEANARHYAFLLEGLADTDRDLRKRGIALVVRRGAPPDIALDLARDAALVVCDRGYLRHHKGWRRRLARGAGRRVEQVETEVVVPVDVASDRAEYAARTLRPKIEQSWREYAVVPVAATPARESLSLGIAGDVDPRDPARALAALDVDRSVAPVRRFRGGAAEAGRRLRAFVRRRLGGYADRRGEPAAWQGSLLSPYLHFGHIAAVEVAAAVAGARTGTGDDVRAFLDELLIRRELAMNFVERTPDYDRYRAMPAWARRTLAAHAVDPRPASYTRAEIEAAETGDPYFDAAMREMVHTGYMHNTMRMYWGKRILAWSRTPQRAYRVTLALNNKYFLDGRDPASYANVGWIFGLHDRPWPERPVFGTVRSMTAAGLERKYDVAAYVAGVDALVARERRAARRGAGERSLGAA